MAKVYANRVVYEKDMENPEIANYRIFATRVSAAFEDENELLPDWVDHLRSAVEK